MNYESEFKAFVDKINTGVPIGGEEIGKQIVRHAQYFGEAVGTLTNAEFNFRIKLSEFEKQTDDNGKILSSTKAESQANATPEYFAYIKAKGHVAVVQEQINSLKSFMKGTNNDYANQGQT